ncbi:hypothetical protein RUM43_007471 [Polyplax serrata]|uniref:NFACT protein C-terminal domain-containing protein n=1 Tax=Polyplax serrata TaxID=468196 RepID=A0AAN8PMN9_POLSC
MSVIAEEEGEEGDSKETPLEFPDTEIKIRHTGKEVSLVTNVAVPKDVDLENEETIVYLGDEKPVIVKSNNQKKKGKEGKEKITGGGNQKNKRDEMEPQKAKETTNKDEEKTKKGRKGKLKKIKEKYKDEDEEDRQLRLEILQNVVKKTQKREKAISKKMEKVNAESKPKSERSKNTEKHGDDGNSDDDTQEPLVNTDLDILSTLTGIPLTEDELLFAIPVVAPYNTLQSYKYKVKLTPGTGKRGKAARTAVTMFLKDKSCTQREKDLLKSVKDENLARNLPGKVKISAPHLHKK